MPSPFPGMNPYFEHPEWWPAIHTDFIVSLRDALIPSLPTAYYVTIELREYEISLAELMKQELMGIGDVSITHEREPTHAPNGPQRTVGQASEHVASPASPSVLTVSMPRPVPVRERYLEIRRPQTHELITVIEVLSPTNKHPGKGRQQYEEKRLAVAETLTNLVEIDLLRAGEPLPVLRNATLLPREMAGDYRVLVARGARPRRAELYPIALREPLPAIPIPLRPGEEELEVDLQQVLHTVYDRGVYGRVLDYRQEPVPPLAPEDAAWADRLLREHGLR